MRTRSMAVLLAAAAATASAQVPAGPEFLVNSYTTNTQGAARVAMNAWSEFVVTWTSYGQDVNAHGVFAQRYRADGTRAGGEFLVPTYTASTEALSDVAFSQTGRSMIVWHGAGSPGFDIHAQRYERGGAPAGGEFTVNTYTSNNEYRPKVAGLPGGGFVVTWSSHAYPATDNRIRAQRFDAFGLPLGGEMQVSDAGPGFGTNFPSIATGADGRFVVAWKNAVPGAQAIVARVFDPAGNPTGPQFVVASPTVAGDTWPDVAMADDGTFVVAWERPSDGSSYGIRARVFSPAGTPLGAEFTANANTLGPQRFPVVAMNAPGDFVIAWSSRVGTAYDVVARRFSVPGAPRSGDFTVNTYTTGAQTADDVASDPAGNFVVTWTSANQDGSASAAMGRRFGGLLPAALALDPAPTTQSDGNGVLEPGESVDVVPSWRNANGAAQAFTGAMLGFGGPAPAAYTLIDAAGGYGTVADGVVAPCVDCYRVNVVPAGPRPALHWDAFAREDLAPDAQGQRKFWIFHLGDSFADVPRSSPYYRFVETLLHAFVSAGCTVSDYCPQAATTREQMAVFVLRARDFNGDAPPACATPMFNDVPAASPFCRWIEELARTGVVAGCGGGDFCPTAAVSREQMAVFVLRTLEPALVPPPCGAPMFADVPASSPFCPWIEELARRGVVTGCGGGNYCPAGSVTREQMGVFISVTFGLRLYGP